MKKRPDGRYVKAITDPKTHKRIYFFGATEREVYKKILEYTKKQEKGKTFREIAEIWWSEIYEELAHQSLKGYKPAYARAVEFFGDDYVRDIEPHDVLAFYKNLVSLDYTQKTISNYRIIINQIFDRAIVEKEIQYNPCSAVKIPKTRKKSVPRKPASTNDEETILKSDHPWLFPVVALLTGLRKGEILALQWRDIDFAEKTISITKSVEHIGKKPHIKEPKTENGVRIVPLLDVLAERLKPLAEGAKPEHYLFSDDGGKTPLSEHRYTRLYKDYQRDVGISATAHPLRKSYATIAVEEEVQPKDLQNALGHADITTTMNIYAAARKRATENVAEKLNAKYSQDH